MQGSMKLFTKTILIAGLALCASPGLAFGLDLPGTGSTGTDTSTVTSGVTGTAGLPAVILPIAELDPLLNQGGGDGGGGSTPPQDEDPGPEWEGGGPVAGNKGSGGSSGPSGGKNTGSGGDPGKSGSKSPGGLPNSTRPGSKSPSSTPTPKYSNDGSGAEGAKSSEGFRTYGAFYCQGMSRKREQGQKGTDFANCVSAVARLAGGKVASPASACKGMSKKRAKGSKRSKGARGTDYSRCVSAAKRFVREQRG